MKTVVKELLKLWQFESAKRHGSHFEKTALKDFVIVRIFLSNGGLELAQLPNFFSWL